jgi:hypothetical protein
MPRYKLRTLLLLLAVLPPLLWLGWTKYAAWKAEQALQEQLRAALSQIEVAQSDLEPIIDEARPIELSSPPKTPMQPLRPEAIDLDKLTPPKAPANAGE